MGAIVTALIFVVCLLLIGIVLIQNSKGGGLDSTFGAGNQVMGVKKTTDFLEKATWGLAISLLVLCLVSASITGGVTSTEGGGSATQSEIKDLINEAPISAPAGLEQPAAAPAQ